MSKLWLYSSLARLPWLGYRDKVAALAAIAAVPPIALMASQGASPAELGAAAVASLAAVAAVRAMLSPVELAARALVEPGAVELTDRYAEGDAAGRLMAGAAGLLAQLDARRSDAERDAVTGLFSRTRFLALADADMQTAQGSVVLGVVRFGDYERLSAFDPSAADEALRTFGERLAGALGAGHVLARVEAGVFAVWLKDLSDPRAASGALKSLAYVLGQDLGGPGLKLSPEVGLAAAVYPDDGRDAVELLTHAVAALPPLGQSSEGKVSFFSPTSTAAARERFAMEQDLRLAVSREQLSLHFQPVVDTAEGRVVGAEALLRWKRPGFGMVPPVEFIPIIEQSGLVEEVGAWVLNAACREARAWADAGLDLKMAINLSARQFGDPAVVKLIARTVERHGVAPKALEIEMTETAAMEDAERTRRLLDELHALGVGVAIDDFGAGYSSMSYLKNLPFSKLKIDREFVTHVDSRRDSQAICRALIELSKGLGIQVLAEGVERREEVETLRQVGCELFQGFFFARPMAGPDFLNRVTDGDWLALLASPVHREMSSIRRQFR